MSAEHDELAKFKRGAKTLGEIIEKQCRDVLDVTGLHHLINEDGDGHWDAVWMRLFEMRDELADLKESTIARERVRGDSWRDRAQALKVALEDVLALHAPDTYGECRRCHGGNGFYHAYPCPTAAAVEAALTKAPK